MLCLTEPTDPRWIDRALGDMDSVLRDHAHCEMKAASNALALVARVTAYPELVRCLVEVASEELSHFQRVLAELARRGISLGKPPVDAYAAELRKVAHQVRSPVSHAIAPLVDRLLVACIIEARSCERFRLLSRALIEPEQQSLQALYEELLAAEARHFRTFYDLAVTVCPDERSAVDQRLSQLARAEGAVCRALPAEPTIHG